MQGMLRKKVAADLIENVRLICEKLDSAFSNPIKMDIYEKDYRRPGTRLFTPPSTITIYEEIDPSKEPEKPDLLAPRYLQLKKKKKMRWEKVKMISFSYKQKILMKVAPEYVRRKEYYDYNHHKWGKVKTEQRMLCAFREANGMGSRAVLIIDDVRSKVERPIRDVFPNAEITYEKRVDKKDISFFRNQQRSFEEIINDEGM